jgi:hypothetical protein
MQPRIYRSIVVKNSSVKILLFISNFTVDKNVLFFKICVLIETMSILLIIFLENYFGITTLNYKI